MSKSTEGSEQSVISIVGIVNEGFELSETKDITFGMSVGKSCSSGRVLSEVCEELGFPPEGVMAADRHWGLTKLQKVV